METTIVYQWRAELQVFSHSAAKPKFVLPATTAAVRSAPPALPEASDRGV